MKLQQALDAAQAQHMDNESLQLQLTPASHSSNSCPNVTLNTIAMVVVADCSSVVPACILVYKEKSVQDLEIQCSEQMLPMSELQQRDATIMELQHRLSANEV